MNEMSDIATLGGLEEVTNFSAYDVLNHFNKHLFPDIKAKFFGVPAKVKKVKKTIWNLFSKKETSAVSGEQPSEENIYDLFGAAIARGLFDFVVGENIRDIRRINLFLNVMYAEMETTAYCNAWLNFNNCAKQFESEGAREKSRIIQESLKLCDQKFWKGVTTIQFTEDFFIFKNGYGTTIQIRDNEKKS